MIYDKEIPLGAGWASVKPYELKGEKFEADLKDGDIIKILDAGTIRPSSFKKANGEPREDKVHKIETRNGVKVRALNQTSINNLIDAYGNDSDNWIGKNAKVWIFKVPKDGKMQYQVFLSHPSAEIEEAEDGKITFTGFGDVDNDEDIDLP